MTNLNSVVLIGRVTAEITERDFAYLSTGTAKLSFSVAVNESRQVNGQWQDEPNFFKIVQFGKMAESLKDKLHKGSKIAISGKLKQNRWKAQDGSNRSEVFVLAMGIEFLDAPKQNNQNGNQNYQNGDSELWT